MLILLFALAMVAAACGDSADTTTPATEAPTTEAPTTEPPATEPPATEPPATEPAANADWPDKITFGFIPSERQETLEDTIQPFMDALAEKLGIEVEGIVTADYNGLVVALGTGQVDFGAFGPVGYVQAEQQYPNVEVLIQSIRFGSATFHGQWFATPEYVTTVCDDEPVPGALENIDGEVVLVDPFDAIALQVGVAFDDDGNKIAETLDDGTPVDFGLACLGDLSRVEGARVALGSPTSTSSSVFPSLQLLNLGFDLDNDVAISHVGSHTDTNAGVYAGDFDIGASFDDARRGLREEFPDVGSKVIVFAITPEVPNDVVAVRGELPDTLKAAFYTAVEEYLATDEGEAVLDEVYGWTDIRPAVDSEFDIVREAQAQLGITEG
jgi:phosphonate transport system substrate-binding protein